MEIFYEDSRAGMSYPELMKKYGMTKGQVAGKLHRWRKRNGIEVIVRPPVPEPEPEPETIPEPEREPCRFTLYHLKPNECRYTDSNVSPYIFCGKPTGGRETSFCPEHHALCWKSAVRKAA